MVARIRIIKHEAVPECGSFEVKFPDGRTEPVFLLGRHSGSSHEAGNVRPRDRSGEGQVVGEG
jgi:hypothetical protein